MKVILGQLEIINNKLDTIVALLIDIRHSIDERSDKDARIRAISELRDIAINFSGWQKYSPRDRDRILASLTTLHKAIEDIEQRDTYGNYLLVAEGMLIEQKLLLLTGLEPEFRKPRFLEYAAYFRKAADPEESASIRHTLVALKSEVATIQANHASLPHPIQCPFGDPFPRCVSSTERCYFRKTRLIEGNLDQGYYETGQEASLNVDNCGPYPPCKPREPRSGPDHGGHGLVVAVPMNVVAALATTDSIPTQPVSLFMSAYSTGCTSSEAKRTGPNLNDERKNYISDLGDIAFLEQVIVTVKQLEEEAKTFAGG